jgi:hypothetical protein
VNDARCQLKLFNTSVEKPKRKDAMKTYKLMPALLVTLSALFLETAALRGEDKEKVVEFADTEIFFEFNSTDLDLGIQLFFDAPGWKRVTVKGPDGRLFEVKNGGGLKRIGSTEVFTESAEPPLSEENLAEEMAEFMAMFPAGEYQFNGTTIKGEKLVGSAELTHNLPAPVSLLVDGFPLIQWIPGAGGPAVAGYEVVAEMVVEDALGEEQEYVNTATFPASVTSFTVSEQFASLAIEFATSGALQELKIEVIAREPSGNKTITEELVFEQE